MKVEGSLKKEKEEESMTVTTWAVVLVVGVGWAKVVSLFLGFLPLTGRDYFESGA